MNFPYYSASTDSRPIQCVFANVGGVCSKERSLVFVCNKHQREFMKTDIIEDKLVTSTMEVKKKKMVFCEAKEILMPFPYKLDANDKLCFDKERASTLFLNYVNQLNINNISVQDKVYSIFYALSLNGMVNVPEVCTNIGNFMEFVVRKGREISRHYENKKIRAFQSTDEGIRSVFLDFKDFPTFYQAYFYFAELSNHKNSKTNIEKTLQPNVVLNFDKQAFVTLDNVAPNEVLLAKNDSTVTTPYILVGESTSNSDPDLFNSTTTKTNIDWTIFPTICPSV